MKDRYVNRRRLEKVEACTGLVLIPRREDYL